MNEGKYRSITDLPLQKADDDQLKLNGYALGLYNFIKDTETPMSIAIQGDWGTGKTSILNLISNLNNNSDASLKMFYINTWQYSQFNGSELLYFSFITSLINQMNLEKDEVKQTLLKYGKLALAAGKSALSVAGLSDIISFIDAAEKMGERIEDQVHQISESKKQFEELVEKYTKDNKLAKLVILVDDLDRLPPKTAVELLEAIKLFMDVKHCVFVLAIDYDVVVQGVREKFGSNISDEKCKSFFDKIIQLPFRMPVESYASLEILKKHLDEAKFEKDQLQVVSKFIDDSIGANPRTLKRIINSFYLIEYVIDSSSENNQLIKGDVRYSLLLVLLSLQIHFPLIYTSLINVARGNEEANLYEEFDKTLNEYLLDTLRISEEEMESYSPAIQNLHSALKKLLGRKDFNKELNNALDISAITSVSSKQTVTARKSATKIGKVKVYDQILEIESGNASAALAKTIELLLKRFPNDLNKIAELDFIRMNDAGEDKSIFRAVQHISVAGHNLYIATSTPINEKIKHISKACRLLNVEDHMVQWFGDDERNVFTYKS
jgi:Cdc6-like AAA superfamily ATPase